VIVAEASGREEVGGDFGCGLMKTGLPMMVGVQEGKGWLDLDVVSRGSSLSNNTAANESSLAKDDCARS
jgi:hypothetical protein